MTSQDRQQTFGAVWMQKVTKNDETYVDPRTSTWNCLDSWRILTWTISMPSTSFSLICILYYTVLSLLLLSTLYAHSKCGWRCDRDLVNVAEENTLKNACDTFVYELYLLYNRPERKGDAIETERGRNPMYLGANSLIFNIWTANWVSGVWVFLQQVTRLRLPIVMHGSGPAGFR